MKNLFGLIIPLLCLHLSSVNSTSNIDKDCTVRERLILKLHDKSTFNVSFYIALDSDIRFQVYFVNQSKFTYDDLVILKPNGGKLQRKRPDFKVTLSNITLNNTIPLGWNAVTITVTDKGLNIGEFYTLKEFGYDIDTIHVTGNYLTSCIGRTPMWNIVKSSVAHIPLTGLSSFGVKLSSNLRFLPEIVINNLSIPLSYNEGLVIRNSSVQLPQDSYHIKIVKHNDIHLILDAKVEDDYMLLMSIKSKEDFMDLKVRSIDGDFNLILQPFQKVRVEFNPTIIIQDLGEHIHLGESHANHNASSAWKVISVIALVLIGILILVIYNLYKTKKYKQKDPRSEDEETPLMNMIQVPVKKIVRDRNRDSHGETNIQMKPPRKEVCKMTLIDDKTISSKKMVGELESKKDRPTKVILVIGQTKSGKSSFINAMVNFIYGVNYEDPFRFKLIDDMDRANHDGTTNTEDIASYHIPFESGIKHDCNYIFVDTPGFGDSIGIDEHKKWNQKFQAFLNNNKSDISKVDGLCFVIKATTTRMIAEQRFIIDGLFSMFGRDITNNIYIVVSYSDGTATDVPEILTNFGVDHKLYILFNDNGIYNDKEFKSKSPDDISRKCKKNWNLAMENLDKLFKDLNNSTAVSLCLTGVVLEENKDINELKDDLFKLLGMEPDAPEKDRGGIQTMIDQNQELLMIKYDEAQKLHGRLKTITCKKDPLAINEYIDSLIENEDETQQANISKWKKLKDRNENFQKFLDEKRSPKSFWKYISGDKTEKNE